MSRDMDHILQDMGFYLRFYGLGHHQVNFPPKQIFQINFCKTLILIVAGHTFVYTIVTENDRARNVCPYEITNWLRIYVSGISIRRYVADTLFVITLFYLTVFTRARV